MPNDVGNPLSRYLLHRLWNALCGGQQVCLLYNSFMLKDKIFCILNIIFRFVFDIKCTLKVLDYDGGLWDCCTLAVSTAITQFRRNDISYNAVTKKLICVSILIFVVFEWITFSTTSTNRLFRWQFTTSQLQPHLDLFMECWFFTISLALVQNFGVVPTKKISFIFFFGNKI